MPITLTAVVANSYWQWATVQKMRSVTSLSVVRLSRWKSGN